MFLGIFRLKFLLTNIFLISSITVYKTVNDPETEHFFIVKEIYNKKIADSRTLQAILKTNQQKPFFVTEIL